MKKTTILILLTVLLSSCKTAEMNQNSNQQNMNRTNVDGPETTIQEGIEVSEDLYNKTFNEIEDLIKELTLLIRKKNFNGWKRFLSEKYIKTVGSAEYLNEISESPSLKDVVKLKTLRDYFQWVVVPSRTNAKLDEIVFKDEQHVTAYMFIEENRTILFQFGWINDQWTITIW